MSRSLGFLGFLGLVIVAGLMRCHAAARAEGLLAAEARTRLTLAELHDASIAITRGGTPHPGLRGAFLAEMPALQPLSELGGEQISYAQDADYVYGLATRTLPDPRSSTLRQGFILRAWPREFGATGDLEYQLADDGQLWQGQNMVGRSGTTVGFPPRFPDPDVGNPDEPWWIIPLPDHR